MKLPSPYLPLIRKDSSTHKHDLAVYVKEGITEAYVQGGTEIQVMYPTDLYLLILSPKFEESAINICTKIYNVDKNYKDLT